MSVKRIAALLAAVIMAVAVLPARSAKAYGEIYYTITLEWTFRRVYVSEEENPLYSGYYDLEYDEDGRLFYRIDKEIRYLDSERIEYKKLSVRKTFEVNECLSGFEFAESDDSYFVHKVTGWTSVPFGSVELESGQPLWQADCMLYDGMTLYAVEWKTLPTVTYHSTYSGETLVSRGPGSDYATSWTCERPYYYQVGWSLEPYGALKYREDDVITEKGNVDLYTVWEQSRISGIPPVIKRDRQPVEHYWFGGKYWRKIGENEEKALLIYDDWMRLGGYDPEHDDSHLLYNQVMDCCTDWYNGFSGAEQAAVCSTDKGEDADTTMPLQGAKLFLLSRLEAYTYFSGRDDRKHEGPTNQWFLRNVLLNLGREEHLLPLVNADGDFSYTPDHMYLQYYVEYYGIYFAAGERPAFVLDLTSILFTSSAESESKFRAPEDGSSFGIFVGQHDPYEGGYNYQQNQKVTLLDETYQAFTAQGNDPDGAAVTPEGMVEISFANALTDTETDQNRYISAMLCDSGDEVLGYASMKPEASSGTWVLTLPPGLDVSEKEYTLKVFNEQQNGVGCSDYASPFSVIHLTKATVPEFGTPDLTMPAELRTIEANAFEGVGEIRAVDARNCTYIGVEAFKGCTELTQIMVDAECEIEEGAFSTEGTVWVYADGAGAAKTFCDAHEGFEFVQVE
ncbi:MAG: leucine-rich repeat protein [Clostridia bacterium]|nr:leucine-rich repeat protein [Clostridia bacterium]